MVWTVTLSWTMCRECHIMVLTLWGADMVCPDLHMRAESYVDVWAGYHVEDTGWCKGMYMQAWTKFSRAVTVVVEVRMGGKLGVVTRWEGHIGWALCWG